MPLFINMATRGGEELFENQYVAFDVT
jgi:hypothetical protein